MACCLGLCLALGLALSGGAAQAQEETSLQFMLKDPDADLFMPPPPEGQKAPKPPVRLAQPWVAVSLQDGQLVLQAVTHTRAPVIVNRHVYTGPPEAPPPPPAPRHALAVPEGTLFTAQLLRMPLSAGSVLLKPGRHASLLPGPDLLHDRWRKTVTLAGRPWQLLTQVQRRADGALRAGSLELVTISPEGRKTVLRVGGSAQPFVRQELVWAGQLAPGGGLDLLLRRTLITGETEYAWMAQGAQAAVQIDPDRPHQVFSSGVDQYESHDQHPGQAAPRPQGRFGVAAFALDEAAFNEALQQAEAKDLPANLRDSTLTLDGERLRFSIDFLPTAKAERQEGQEGQPSGEAVATVRVSFRGKTQVLMLTGPLDGGLKVQVDKLQGQPAIRIEHWPHYNNQFFHYFVWDAGQGRFLRLAREHHQGC